MKNLIIITITILFVSCTKVDVIECNKNANAGFYQTSSAGKNYTFNGDKREYKLDSINFIPFANVDFIMCEESGDIKTLNIMLDQEGQANFKIMSEDNIGKNICLLINNEIVAAPIVREPIVNGKMTIQLASREVDKIIAKIQ